MRLVRVDASRSAASSVIFYARHGGGGATRGLSAAIMNGKRPKLISGVPNVAVSLATTRRCRASARPRAPRERGRPRRTATGCRAARELDRRGESARVRVPAQRADAGREAARSPRGEDRRVASNVRTDAAHARRAARGEARRSKLVPAAARNAFCASPARRARSSPHDAPFATSYAAWHTDGPFKRWPGAAARGAAPSARRRSFRRSGK